MNKEIVYVGVNDHEVDLFEGMYEVPKGMAYNSYVILDEKIAVLDTVDAGFADEWLGKVADALQGRKPDYLVIHHVEPDHSANIQLFLEKYPDTTVVGNSKTFVMVESYFPNVVKNKSVVKEGDVLNLGKHKLSFIMAPMVHWPEVMVSYDSCDKVLFSADAFGKFGANDIEDSWACEARRYYFGIVGKYGVQVQNLLKKASSLEIKVIAPLHGPILTENLDYYLNLYNIWSSYGVESEGVFIAYTSVYGHTKKAVEVLKEELLKAGCVKVAVADLARDDMAEGVEDAFRYGKLVLATTTYNGEIFPFMREFLNNLTERGYKNRTIGFIENGSWAPMATKVMKNITDGWKNIQYLDSNLTIKSALHEEDYAVIKEMAQQLCK